MKTIETEDHRVSTNGQSNKDQAAAGRVSEHSCTCLSFQVSWSHPAHLPSEAFVALREAKIKKKTLALFFVNVNNAYSCYSLPPLGRSDHNLYYYRTANVQTDDTACGPKES
ncbi:hypothetical protein ElyMa_006681300 [Elysia marginata]|uniref:Uncharacterized protein n=1 Tax=Elysia marginata TaxID=1093978 RepID=A0AAV4IMC0_9GAST|nr:hypothetical protein ElyMa_006681300 [Elysia marginata]